MLSDPCHMHTNTHTHTYTSTNTITYPYPTKYKNQHKKTNKQTNAHTYRGKITHQPHFARQHAQTIYHIHTQANTQTHTIQWGQITHEPPLLTNIREQLITYTHKAQKNNTQRRKTTDLKSTPLARWHSWHFIKLSNHRSKINSSCSLTFVTLYPSYLPQVFSRPPNNVYRNP
jgi:hypothetical protein